MPIIGMDEIVPNAKSIVPRETKKSLELTYTELKGRFRDILEAGAKLQERSILPDRFDRMDEFTF